METVAVYFEKQIKTYGFSVSPSQIMLTWHLEESFADVWGRALTAADASGLNFSSIFTRSCNTGKWIVSCVAAGDAAEKLADLSKTSGIPRPARTFVDLLFFHGPHFNERPGIAAETLSALQRERITPLAVSCVAHSVYLVLPDGIGDAAKNCLISVFEVPKKPPKDRRRPGQFRSKGNE